MPTQTTTLVSPSGDSLHYVGPSHPAHILRPTVDGFCGISVTNAVALAIIAVAIEGGGKFSVYRFTPGPSFQVVLSFELKALRLALVLQEGNHLAADSLHAFGYDIVITTPLT